MLEEADFIYQIRANPRDVSVRLIYADFLEDQGDVRGEFIRVQCQLTDPDFASQDRTGLLAREAELLQTHGESWLAPLRDCGALGLSLRCFERGLIQRARFGAEVFARSAEAICNAAPALSMVELRDVDFWTNELTALAWPAQIDRLDLRSSQLSLDFFKRLQGATIVTNVKALGLDFVKMAAQTVTDLIALDWPLTELSVVSCGLGTTFCEQLTSSGMLRRFQRLFAPVNDLGSGVQQLAQSPKVANIETLDLSSTRLGDEGLMAIIMSPHWSHLRELVLRNNRLTADAYRDLPGASWLAKLRRLDLRNNAAIHPAIVQHIANFRGEFTNSLSGAPTE
jgi:uncharacterized protein (TIGR02996 family)